MKDHAAPKRPYSEGVKLEELNNAAPQVGVITEALDGGVAQTPTPIDGGIAWHMPPPPKSVPKVAACEAATKTGAPCKARPLSGQAVCIGHSRVKADGQSIDSE